MNIKKAVDTLRKELKNDKDFYYAYQANIAMAFKDEYARTGNNLSYKKVHKVANRAAQNFLNMLIK